MKRLVALLVGAALLTGCVSAADGATGPTSGTQLTVYAAASLRDAMARLATAYGETADVTVTVSTGSSAALRAQIEQGAPADVFLSADTENAEALVEAGLADGEAVVFATNELTVIVPASNPAGIDAPAELAREGVSIVAAADGVPITGYALEVVERLGIRERYAANVVSREDSVRAIVTKVVLGEADAGIVYATDAAAAGKQVGTVAIPSDANVVARYAAVVVAGSARTDAARAFTEWLVAPGGQALLEASGFLPAP